MASKLSPIPKLVLRRLAIGALTLIVVSAVIFWAVELLPGNIATEVLGQSATPETIAAFNAQFGLNDPPLWRYVSWLGNAMQGDFGQSLATRRPITDLIGDRAFNTFFLAGYAALIAVPVSILLGLIAALYRGSLLDRWISSSTLAVISFPEFFVAYILILIFAVQLGWFPSFGRGEVVQLGWWSSGLLTAKGWHHIAMPAVTLAIFQLTLIMRLVRAEMLEVLRTDYIKFARARGLTNRAVHFGHALKNTLVPVMTPTGLQLGGLIAFAIITETVFQWPGMGLLFIQAVTFADIPVMAAYLCLIALIFVVINL
ncbi:MAG TPA: ABC transporter permease, partial [Gemmobacter sp.]|nr:ABC transporter permease [Gemmobacter sp.]